MDSLKMKFKLHSLEFEIEGNETTVKQEFENFKSFITGELLSKINVVTPQVTSITPASQVRQISTTPNTELTDISEYPVLKEVVKKDLPKTESEWILIYGLYSSGFGENPFSEKDIRSQYEATGRKQLSRLNNITNNVKSLLNKGYFKMHNDTEYLIKESGIEYAKQILLGNSTGKAVSRPSKKSSPEVNGTETEKPNKKDKATKTNAPKFVDLALPPNEINLLTEFFNSKKPQTQNEKIAVVMKWYKDHINNADISIEEINYLMKICSKVPTALGQVLINMKGDAFRWVSNAANGKIQLTSIGETYVISKLPKTTK